MGFMKPASPKPAPLPPPPAAAPTLANVGAAGSQQKVLQAEASGGSFGGTVANEGGAKGTGSGAQVGKRSLLG
jgi:hypothetical protein